MTQCRQGTGDTGGGFDPAVVCAVTAPSRRRANGETGPCSGSVFVLRSRPQTGPGERTPQCTGRDADRSRSWRPSLLAAHWPIASAGAAGASCPWTGSRAHHYASAPRLTGASEPAVPSPPRPALRRMAHPVVRKQKARRPASATSRLFTVTAVIRCAKDVRPTNVAPETNLTSVRCGRSHPSRSRLTLPRELSLGLGCQRLQHLGAADRQASREHPPIQSSSRRCLVLELVTVLARDWPPARHGTGGSHGPQD